MKKLILIMAVVTMFGTANAQKKKPIPVRKAVTSSSSANQTAEGKILIEANTGFGQAHPASTAISFSSTDGASDYNVGVEGGYFIMDDLAVKVGLGFGGNSPKEGDGTSRFSYKIGAKYYILSMIPVQLDYSGVKPKGDASSFLGIQAGYALFLGDNVSVEPGIRYNMTLNKDTAPKDTLEFNVGFALHF